MDIFKGDWSEYLDPELEKDYYLDLRRLLIQEYRNFQIYPKPEEIYRALHLTSFEDTKVLILGQDPYHGEGQAEGLAFSVPNGVALPPSLKNIYKEIESDIGCEMDWSNGSLIPWAEQGVLLLNTTLTVRKGQAGSHSKIGWEFFTDYIIQCLNKKESPMVYLLWGAHARSKKRFLNNPKHLILESPHPSPLSAYRGFFGCKHFSKTNKYLEANGETAINWCNK